MNTGAEVTICHMLGKCEEKFTELLTSFFSFFQHFFFLWVKTFAICLSVFTLRRRMDAGFGCCDFWDCFWVG